MVKFKDQFYTLHRLGFGLNCAPEIIKAIVSKILSLDESVSKGTDYYYDDNIVDLNEVSVEKVKEHFLNYGLITKPCENLGSAKLLGLKTDEKKGVVRWERTEFKSEIESPNLDSMAKRHVLFPLRKIGWSLSGWWLVASCSKFREARLPR